MATPTAWKIFPQVPRHSLLMASVLHAPVFGPDVNWVLAVLAIVQEALIGLAIGLAARMIFMSVQQGGALIAMQMGMADASVIDPISGEESPELQQFLDSALTLVFLAAGGHLLLMVLLQRGFQVFPPGHGIEIAALTQGLVHAGAAMLNFGLALAAPMVAAYLVLSVVLAVLARALPEMNILFESFPLRVGLGLIMTAAILPSMSQFVHELMFAMARII